MADKYVDFKGYYLSNSQKAKLEELNKEYHKQNPTAIETVFEEQCTVNPVYYFMVFPTSIGDSVSVKFPNRDPVPLEATEWEY
jgi:hypothetical protein